ncbi:MAG: MBOAT family protein [Bacteroidia bacterium]
MHFHSLVFAVFLPLVFAGYWGLRSLRLRHAWLLAASYVFYGWWDWRFLGLIVLSSAVDYVAGQQLARASRRGVRRAWLAASLAINLGALAFFKYCNFFIASLEATLQAAGIGVGLGMLPIILPVGISFYTFQTLSYTIDIYRGQLQPSRDPLAFFAYVAFFPQLVAGPIERAARMLPQFGQLHRFDRQQAVQGLRLMLYGFFKKIVIADNLARWVDPTYAAPEQYPGLPLLLATLGFAVQIYADFSAYSDIATGCARLFGFELMRNFHAPYGARSLRDFWARWHISLSTWFRDYVYIPLGGNRRRRLRNTVNLLLTFGLSGLWHGASWGFVVWGLIHGLAYAVERTRGRPSGRVGTLLIVVAAWVFFRANDLDTALAVFRAMGQGLLLPAPDAWLVWATTLASPREGLYLLLSLGLLGVLEPYRYRAAGQRHWLAAPRWQRWAAYYGLVVWIAAFGAYETPRVFIYFQF